MNSPKTDIMINDYAAIFFSAVSKQALRMISFHHLHPNPREKGKAITKTMRKSQSSLFKSKRKQVC